MPLTLSKLERGILAAFGAAYLLVGLGAYGLLDNNEGLYAEMAREMLQARSFVVPHLVGVPYLEKPPLLAWLLAGAYAAFGTSEVVSRLVPVSATLLLLAGLVAFGRSMCRPSLGWISAAILATSGVFAMLSRTVFPDALLTALFGGAVLLFHAWHRQRRRVLLVASYALLGLAALAKGFVALALGGMVFVAFSAWQDGAPGVRALLDPGAIGALLAVVVPWHVALALADGDFAWFYVVNEHVLRYIGLRRPHDYYTGPPWYYLPRIPLYLFPWSVFFVLLPLRGRDTAEDDEGLERLLWIWFASALAFFSISEAKANYYMIVAAPALALLVADRIERLVAAGRTRPMVLCALAIAVAGAAAAVLAYTGVELPRRGLWRFVLKRREELALAITALAAMSAFAAALFAAARWRLAVLALALAGFPLLLFGIATAERGDRWGSSRALAAYLRARPAVERVLLYEDYERLSSLPVYLDRPVGVVDSRSNDLAFGMTRGEGPFLESARARELLSGRSALLLVHRKRAADFRRCLGDAGLRPVARIGNVVVYERGATPELREVRSSHIIAGR
ncbi:MAG TPA: glycosyltransferase family 39 protein [Burkholderiales bacterium]|nr:glycosyltransferase family 39 protein [Burkholderiales bacterium]